MTKHPFLNALLALVYITIVASCMFYGQRFAPKGPDTVIIPIAMISLFSLSAAVMGYLFLLMPVELYFDGKKKAGVALLLKTILCFAGLTAVALVLMLSGLFK